MINMKKFGINVILNFFYIFLKYLKNFAFSILFFVISAKAEAGEQTELKERRSGKKGSAGSGCGRRTSKGNGEVKSDGGSGHSQQSGQSKRSGRGGPSLAFSRSDLNSLVSLGTEHFNS